MNEFEDTSESLAGSLLLSHPALMDPHFRRSVVLISAHSGAEGAIGAILNRPKGMTLGEVDSSFAFGALAEVPVYEGGPVRTEDVILAGWRWVSESSIFKLHFGIDPEQATELSLDEDFRLRAFVGYAGWGEGQLEDELKLNSWLVSRIDGELLETHEGTALWRHILRGMGPEMRLMADFPDDPSGN